MKKILFFSAFLALAAIALPAQEFPALSVEISGGAAEGQLSSTLRIVLLITLLTFLPAILMMMTSFTRIVITFHFLRQAMGVQGVPPNQVLIGLSLFMTIFVMSPVGMQIHSAAVQPYQQGEVNEMDALQLAAQPLQEFMLRQTREKDLSLFYELSRKERPKNRSEVEMVVLVPAFILSELKTAFQIGFLLFIPFLIIDIVVASILVSLGMIFLPPIMVALPFKIVLFILADGWHLIVGSILKSFNLGGG